MAFKVESWEKFMKVYAGWSPDKTANSIKNYGYGQVNDFLRDAEQTFNRQLTHGVGRTLGSFANSFNPAAIDKQSKSAKNAALDREKTNVYAGLNNLKQMATNWKDILDKSAIDTVNGLVASAATWYGEDVVKSVGFVPGGASEVKVDLIGEVTGQSQPQTFKIDQKTGEVSGGDITPISKAKEVEATGETSPEAKTLARTMLLRDETTDLGMNPIWQSAPDDVRKQAFQELKRITSSPESMADFVIENEVQDLQNFSWWNINPHKQQAWTTIQQRQAKGKGIGKTGGITGTQATPETITEAPTTPTIPTTPTTPETPKAPTTEPTADEAKAIIDQAVAEGILTPDEGSLFAETAKGWDPLSEVNIENIMREFNRIKSQTIDPQFQQLTSLAISDLERAKVFQEQQRAIELEAERASAGENIRQARAGLEKAGMTFTGKAIETLGAESAFAQPGAQGVSTPFQQPFGGMFFEGLVPQSNRLIATSSEARFKRNLEALGQQAERQLGSGQAGMFNLPGFAVTGGITGTLPQQREQQLGTTLTDLYGQERQNILARNL